MSSERALVAIVGTLWLLGGCAPSVATTNLAPTWDAFAVRAATMDGPTALAEFRRVVAPSFPEFYRWRLKRLGERAASVVADHVKRHGATRGQFNAVAERFQARLERALPTFRRVFGAFAPPRVYLLHSLGELDGGTREIAGKVYFLFGVDNIVRYHGFDNEMPFFHHELFHVYRGARVPNVKIIISALYEEGLAVYVSHKLNPRATAAELLLDAPTGMVKACRARFGEVARLIVDTAMARDNEAYRALFLMQGDHDLPPRCGYWVGYWLVNRFRKGRSLAELALLTGDALWAELVAEMRVFAAEGAPATDLIGRE